MSLYRTLSASSLAAALLKGKYSNNSGSTSFSSSDGIGSNIHVVGLAGLTSL